MKDNMLKLYVKATGALKSDEGLTAVEYAVLLAIIVVAVAAGARVLAPQIQTAFSTAMP